MLAPFSNPHLLCPKTFHWTQIRVVALFVSFVQIKCRPLMMAFSTVHILATALFLYCCIINQSPASFFISCLKQPFNYLSQFCGLDGSSPGFSWDLWSQIAAGTGISKMTELLYLAPWLEQLCSRTLALPDPSLFIWPFSLMVLAAGWLDSFCGSSGLCKV